MNSTTIYCQRLCLTSSDVLQVPSPAGSTSTARPCSPPTPTSTSPSRPAVTSDPRDMKPSPKWLFLTA